MTSLEDYNKQIIEKLDVVIKLLSVGIVKGKEVKEQILLLNKIGISNKDIAEILGKTQNTVNSTLSQSRRKKNE